MREQAAAASSKAPGVASMAQPQSFEDALAAQIAAANDSAVRKQAALQRHKLGADFGVGFTPSGPTLSAFDSVRERLPGMHRWVPRETIEDVYRQLDMGVDPSEVKDSSTPWKSMGKGTAVGATAGAVMGRLPGAVLGGAIGAGGGLLAHFAGRKSRDQDTQEALHGVLAEHAQESLPYRLLGAKNSQPSARESMPLTVSTNVGI